MCVFHNEKYIRLLELLIQSIFIKSNLNRETTDILIVTSPEFKKTIQNKISRFNLPVKYFLLDLHTLMDAACARLNIFNYEDINVYSKILYLDTDILINDDINTILNLEISSNKIYVFEEGTIEFEAWAGPDFFDFSIYNKNQTAFSSGILFFIKDDSIKELFIKIQSHIYDWMHIKGYQMPQCMDQPFTVYNAIVNNMFDNKLLNSYIHNNYDGKPCGKIINHFSGCPGDSISKYDRMMIFWNNVMNRKGVLINKTYSWNDNAITFLEDNIMYAFGKGYYTQSDTYNFKAEFGGRTHEILFNKDYTKFTSKRVDDNEIVKGFLLDTNKPMANIKICQYSCDGFGHQLEGILRLVSSSLNKKADYQYHSRKSFSFEHSNFNAKILEDYIFSAYKKLEVKEEIQKDYTIVYEGRSFKNIMLSDTDYETNVYYYDGVGCGNELPDYFEEKEDLIKSLPELRKAFVEENTILPRPSYDNAMKNVCVHIRLGDAINTRILDNENIYKLIRHFQQKKDYRLIIHSNGDIQEFASENTYLYDSNTDVLQILSDFIHSDIFIMNYSSLSIAAHLLADPSQVVICPNKAGSSFYERILDKCIRIDDYIDKNKEEYTAVILEPRKHKAMEFVLANFLDNLDERWSFIIYHGTENEEWLNERINQNTEILKYKDRITLKPLGVKNMNLIEYSSQLTNYEFISSIPTEVFLVFQADTMISKPYKDLIYDFMKYDYVGAPWASGEIGNGGLSLRRKTKMLEIIKAMPYEESETYRKGLGEDIYFHRSNLMNRPSFKKAKEFSIETVYSPKAFGVHAAWKYIDDITEEQCPGYNELVRLNMN